MIPPRLHRMRRAMLAITTLLWLGAFIATHVPTHRLPGHLPGDVTLHLVGYLGLAAAVLLTMAFYAKPRRRRIATIFIVMAVYGAIDEITQPLVGRYAAWKDWAADLAGTALAVLIVEALLALLTRRTQAKLKTKN